jgi:bifunctional N-acetylglucosamine-1-phosphate-uridyltransferase/glucosamine-1-phosphate-acetyltransferase GlmU-like protein
MNILVANIETPKGYGRIIYDNQQSFIEIVEEKDCSDDQRQCHIINSGIYFMNADILHNYIPMIDNKNKQQEYYLTDIVKTVRMHNATSLIHTYLIDPSQNTNISGVNTQEELLALENMNII